MLNNANCRLDTIRGIAVGVGFLCTKNEQQQIGFDPLEYRSHASDRMQLCNRMKLQNSVANAVFECYWIQLLNSQRQKAIVLFDKHIWLIIREIISNLPDDKTESSRTESTGGPFDGPMVI